MEYMLANLREMLFNTDNIEKIPLQVVELNKKYVIKTRRKLFFNTCFKIIVLELTNNSILFKKDNGFLEENRMHLVDFNKKYLIVEKLDCDDDKINNIFNRSREIMTKIDNTIIVPFLAVNNDYIIKNIGYYGYDTTNKIRVLELTNTSVLFMEMDNGEKIRLDLADFNSFYKILEKIKN